MGVGDFGVGLGFVCEYEIVYFGYLVVGEDELEGIVGVGGFVEGCEGGGCVGYGFVVYFLGDVVVLEDFVIGGVVVDDECV